MTKHAKTSTEVTVSDVRQRIAEVVNDVAVHGQIVYITRNGRRVAAIVPVPVAEQFDQPPG